jgi:thioredoxin-related protein
MKSTLLALATTLALTATSLAAEWLTDLPTAQAKAKRESKLVLMDFTGSDWCGWCIKMKKESLDKPEFSQYATKNLVLVEVDFPNQKKLSAEQKKANDALKSKYNVEGYPTFVITDADGKELGRQVGYLEGGPQAFIDKITSFKPKA